MFSQLAEPEIGLVWLYSFAWPWRSEYGMQSELYSSNPAPHYIKWAMTWREKH